MKVVGVGSGMEKELMPTLEKFKDKRKLWLDYLGGNDQNSILNQVYRMIWDAAVFRVVNESRKYPARDKEGNVPLNEMVHTLINKFFFESQASAIRRLIDRSASSGERGVYSLYRLLEDMENDAHLFTRKNIIDAEGLKYDYRLIVEEWQRYSAERAKQGVYAYWVPPHLDWQSHERRHMQIDQLAGVDQANRGPHDRISDTVFVKLREKLSGGCLNTFNFVNKFIAHAAIPGSRSTIDPNELRITLGHLWAAQGTICKVANFVRVYLLHDSSTAFLAVPQYDQFQYLERPWVAPDDIRKLRDVWSSFDSQTHQWNSWGIEQFKAEMGA